MGKKIVPTDDPSRTARILSERDRKIGVDVQGLDKQVLEKQERVIADREKLKREDDAWLASWRTVEEVHERREAARRRRQTAYRTDLWEQIEAKRSKKRLENTSETHEVAGFMDGFQKSHR